MTKSTHLIGLTGSIGSGKSTVATFFESWGSLIVDFDLITRDLLTNYSEVITEIRAEFGAQILRPNGSIDRFGLRSLIFQDADCKLRLEEILHPRIRAKATEISAKSFANGIQSVTLVIPLLFESKLPYPDLTETVVVASPRSECIARASLRDNCPKSLISRIYDAQLPLEEKKSKADYVINNDSSLEALEVVAREVFNQIHSV